jgi:chorismate synthase
MSTLRFLTAGESHGSQLTAILEGCPSRLALTAADIDRDLGRRQLGFGRGGRMAIETDRVEIVGGVRHGFTTGGPVALVIKNRDADNWAAVMDVNAVEGAPPPVTVARPGHADLGGALLYGHDDMRDVIERASARETAARVACGAVARRLLAEIGCTVWSHVVRIGEVEAATADAAGGAQAVDADPVRCLDAAASGAMQAAIISAGERGDTLGGVFVVIAEGFPAGVGSYVEPDRRLGAALAGALLSIPAVKGFELGAGFSAAALPGSLVHDEIFFEEERGYYRATNRAGGVEGGMSTGAPIVVRAAMKPIATLMEPLSSVDMHTHAATQAHVERSDVCAVPAAAVVGEAVVALALAAALLERFGGASIGELRDAVEAFADRIRRR